MYRQDSTSSPTSPGLLARLHAAGLDGWLSLSALELASRLDLDRDDRATLLRGTFRRALVGKLVRGEVVGPPRQIYACQALLTELFAFHLQLRQLRLDGASMPELALALERWAQAHGLAAVLDQNTRALAEAGETWLWSYAGSFSLRQGLLSAAHPAAGAAPLGHRFVRLLTSYLTAQAELFVAHEATVQDWRAAPPPAPLQPWWKFCWALRERLVGSAPVAARRLSGRVALKQTPLRAEVCLDNGHRVSFFLESPAADGFAVDCECRLPAQPCAGWLPALDVLLHALHAPQNPMRSELLHVLSVPGWQRALAALAFGNPDSAAEGVPLEVSVPTERTRLAFQLLPRSRFGRGLELRLQKIGARGTWTAGRELNPEEALLQLHRPDCEVSDAERRALHLLAGQSPQREAFDETALWLALEALGDHPRLTDATTGHALRVRHGQVELELQSSDELAPALHEATPDSPAAPSAVGPPTEALAPLHALDQRGGGAVALAASERQSVSVDGDRLRLALRLEGHGVADLGEALQTPGSLAIARDGQRGLVWLVRNSPELRRAAKLVAHQALFPPESHGALLSALAPLERGVPLRLPAALAGTAVDPDLRLRVRLEPQGLDLFEASGGLGLAHLGLTLTTQVEPLPGAPRFPPGEGPQRLTGQLGGQRRFTDRDLPDERARARGWLARLGLPAAHEREPFVHRLAGEEALEMLERLDDPSYLDGSLAEWPAAKVRVVASSRAGPLRVRIVDRRDWFGVEGGLSLPGPDGRLAEASAAQLAALLDAIRHKRRYLPVGKGQWLRLADELRARLAPLAALSQTQRGELALSPAAALGLETFSAGLEAQDVSLRWRTLTAKAAAVRQTTPRLPRKLNASLRDYQVEGFRWLARLGELGLGACLADDMGLGKTLQALALLAYRAERGPALVICPTSVAGNWLAEARRFAPRLPVRLYREGGRAGPLEAEPGTVQVVSYGLLVEDRARFEQVRFATVVLDEAQALKNATTLRAKTVRELDAEFKVALTGTPVENHLGELWSLFRILTPGLLGSWEHFRERFAAPIERGAAPEALEALAAVVRPFLLRRTKAEVARDLPARTELTVPVELSAGERVLYDAQRLSALGRLAGVEDADDRGRFQVLAELTRLRQLACHPRLVAPESQLPSAKLERFLELVAELREEGHRALVFSQFTSHLALVREALDALKIAYLYLDGATPPAARDRLVAAFQGGQGELFLISLKAGGTGLNLTGADHVVHLDPWWNPAVEDQATDRAHRIGQTKPVTVSRLVAQGTVEEAILALHSEKRDLVAGLLSGSERAGKLSTSELLALMSGGDPASPRTATRSR